MNSVWHTLRMPLSPVRSETVEQIGVNVFYRLGSTPFFKKVHKRFYALMTRWLSADDVVFLNFGYEEDPPMALPLAASDEPNRFCIQLYHRTATQADLSGKQVLEVSCGHGGGASYLMRTLRPASYTGLDLNPAGIDFCRKRHNLPGLDFVHGDAENLPFADESFDAVINVEASHCLPSLSPFPRRSGARAAPGRAFPVRRFPRPREASPSGRRRLADAPMRLLSRRGSSMRRFCAGWRRIRRGTLDLIGRHLPAFLRRFARRIRRRARLAVLPRPATREDLVPDVLLHQGLKRRRSRW